VVALEHAGEALLAAGIDRHLDRHRAMATSAPVRRSRRPSTTRGEDCIPDPHPVHGCTLGRRLDPQAAGGQHGTHRRHDCDSTRGVGVDADGADGFA
jgi:hypothetical protein